MLYLFKFQWICLHFPSQRSISHGESTSSYSTHSSSLLPRCGSIATFASKTFEKVKAKKGKIPDIFRCSKNTAGQRFKGRKGAHVRENRTYGNPSFPVLFVCRARTESVTERFIRNVSIRLDTMKDHVIESTWSSRGMTTTWRTAVRRPCLCINHVTEFPFRKRWLLYSEVRE